MAMTRGKTELFLVGQPKQEFPQGVLPTLGDVLAMLLGRKKEKGKTFPFADLVGCAGEHGTSSLKCRDQSGCIGSAGDSLCLVAMLEQVWREAGLTTVCGRQIKRRVLAEHTIYANLLKSKAKSGRTVAEQRDLFKSKLDKLFDIAAETCIETIQKDRLRDESKKIADISFLKDQRDQRLMRFTVLDKSYSSKVATREEKELRARKFEEKNKLPERETASYEEESMDEENEEDEEGAECADLFISPPKKVKRVSKKVSLAVPKNILTHVAPLASRFNLTPNVVSAIVGSVVTASGGDLDNFTVSATSARRGIVKSDLEIAGDELERFREMCEAGGRVIIHFDGKKMAELGIKANKKAVERVGILATWGNEYQLLGIVPLLSGTGESLANAIFDLLVERGARDAVVGLSYDTTAANSGPIKGAVTRLEKKLNKSVLKLPCRHHIMELHSKHVAFKVSKRATTGPGDVLFRKFTKSWDNMDKTLTNFYNWGEEGGEKLDEKALQILGWANDWVEKKSFERGDYKYLSQLLCTYFGPPREEGFQLKKPHNLNPARFVQKAIFYLEMFLLGSNKLSELGFEAVELLEINRMGHFVAFYYIPWFLRSPMSAAAPYADLIAIAEMREAKYRIQEEATTCLLSWQRHLDYLSPALVILSLADKSTPVDEKRAVADALLNVICQDELDDFPPGSGKILIPGTEELPFTSSDIYWEDGTPSLGSFVGRESFLLLHLYGILSAETIDWLVAPVVTWPGNTNFQDFSTICEALHVVNDIAERSIKLAQDFTKEGLMNESLLQNKFLAVSGNRKRIRASNGVLDKRTLKTCL